MENGRLNKNKYLSGFSLIEALVTVVIFSLTFIAFMSFSSYGVKITQSSQERTNANLIANMILEDIQIDIDNIDAYNNFNLNTNETLDKSGNKYKWKSVISTNLLTPTSNDTRKIIVSNIKINNQDKKLVEVNIKSLNGSININVTKVY